MSKFGQASRACITVGFPIPYIILSRADTLETRLLSVALCSIYAQRTVGERKKSLVKKTPRDERKYRILVINPGSTSIKIALFENKTPLHEQEISHVGGPIDSPGKTKKEIEIVLKYISKALEQWKEKKINAIAARGGFVPRPSEKLKGGVYTIASVTNGGIVVDERLVAGIINHPEMVHASNLGIPVAAELAKSFKIPAYFVDPVVVDEFIPEAEVSGFKPIRRLSTSHALSVRAASRKAAELIGRPVDDINLVVAHLGGGITVAAVKKGRMIDGNIALLGDGPFTPNRAGTLPLRGILDLCFSGKYTRETLAAELSKKAGLYSYLGTYRMEDIEKRIESEEEARIVVNALVHRVVKEIGAMYAVLGVDVEAVVLTGGLIKSPIIQDMFRRRVSRIAPILIFEGSLEMEALADQSYRVLSGIIKPFRFPTVE
jgi:butyrate kinase